MDDMGRATPMGRALQESRAILTAPNHVCVIIFMLTDMEKPVSVSPSRMPSSRTSPAGEK
jgi:hypothetical protein